ncbi:cell envelope integrity protein TolA [bacterium]|nr:cell envelope integrity protein TolA [bacterium]
MISCLGHALGIGIAVFILERSEAKNLTAEVFTVTLEGGQRLGGVAKVPELGAEKDKNLPAALNTESETKATEPPQKEKKLEAPSIVEDPAKLLEEQKKKEAEQKKLAEEKKKKELEEKKKLEEEKKKLEKEKKDEAAKKLLEDVKKREKEEAEQEKKRREKLLEDALAGKKANYKGESADVGGEGPGAARLGGTGGGGGKLGSLEFVAYRNALMNHIKKGWHWMPGGPHLQARIEVRIEPTGEISSFRLLNSSGRSDFDDSAMRAVQKSSPVPPPPAALIEIFKTQAVLFDSQDQ